MDSDDAFSPFHTLAPEQILNAVETSGFVCNGRITALNSYENRVYQIGIEDGDPVIAKFYRPGRWTDAAILEEHGLTAELAQQEIPVMTPMKIGGETLFHAGLFRFSLYPRARGRAPELDDPAHLVQLGRCLARIHNIGALSSFRHRPHIDIDSFAASPRKFLLAGGFIPDDLIPAYRSVTDHIIAKLVNIMESVGDVALLRLHGDSHLGNILWHDGVPCVVDFDDARMGPSIQDLWMFLSGDRNYMTVRLHDLLDGYCEFREFDARELRLIEVFRTMRMIHHAGWLAQRWDDPAFPSAFPWFNTQRFWQDHILHLKEQLSMMDEPPLEWRQN